MLAEMLIGIRAAFAMLHGCGGLAGISPLDSPGRGDVNGAADPALYAHPDYRI